MTKLTVINGAIPSEFAPRCKTTTHQEGSSASEDGGIEREIPQRNPLLQTGAEIRPTSTGHPTGFSLQNMHIDGGIISEISGTLPLENVRTFDATDCVVLPGFVDLHVHGAVGRDTMDASVDALYQMASFFAQHGVTAFVPTTMTAPPEKIVSAIRTVDEAVHQLENDTPFCAQILGTHVEGPFISRRFPGAQPANDIRPPDLAEFARMTEAGPVRMITLAPEEPGALGLIADATRRGIASVVGHSNATFAECQRSFQAGVSQATHTYNAMSGLHHRTPGTLGAVLADDRVYAQLIADNIHVHPAAMKILARCKGVERTILITDAMRAVGLPPGDYELGGQQVTVQNGECRLADGTLAGSILTMEQGLANFIEATGIPLWRAWPISSRTPAQALGLEQRFGSLARGYCADLVVLDLSLTVVATIVGGRVVYLHKQHQERYSEGKP